MKPLGEHTVVSVQEILAYVDRDRYMDKREAAAYTSLSLRNLEARLPEIPHFRVGKKLLFKKSELDRWLEQFREGGAQNLERIADEALESTENSVDCHNSFTTCYFWVQRDSSPHTRPGAAFRA